MLSWIIHLRDCAGGKKFASRHLGLVVICKACSTSRSKHAAEGCADQTREASAGPPAEQGLVCLKMFGANLAQGEHAKRQELPASQLLGADKWLVRICQKPKANAQESAEAKDRREKGETLRANLKKMTPAEKVKWYCKQKEERR